MPRDLQGEMRCAFAIIEVLDRGVASFVGLVPHERSRALIVGVRTKHRRRFHLSIGQPGGITMLQWFLSSGSADSGKSRRQHQRKCPACQAHHYQPEPLAPYRRPIPVHFACSRARNCSSRRKNRVCLAQHLWLADMILTPATILRQSPELQTELAFSEGLRMLWSARHATKSGRRYSGLALQLSSLLGADPLPDRDFDERR